MTDNKIIKALECCTDESYENCNECPYSTDTLSCERLKLLEDSLDLINHQKAENKRLEKEVNLVSIQFQDLQERYEEAQAEIERLKKENEILIINADNAFQEGLNENRDLFEEEVKLKLYKEFAEKLKKMADRKPFETLEYVSTIEIDELVKVLEDRY